MSISDHGHVRPSHTALTVHETSMLDADAELSRVAWQAVEDQDMDTLAEALAEKMSIERAFQSSRWDTFNHRMGAEFFGSDT